MSTTGSLPGYRIGLHVHLYLWVALLVFSLVVPFLISVLLFLSRTDEVGFYAFLVLVAIFQVLFWFACHRCASPELGVWKGLLYVSRFMTVGIGMLSILVAVPSVVAAIFVTVGIALRGLFGHDAAEAPKRFVALVKWFQHRRMYQ